MRKFFFLIAVMAFCAQGINAKVITPAQAEVIAKQQFARSTKLNASNVKMNLNYVAKNMMGQADYYVFNREGGNGYVVVAGDDMSTSVLAYGEKGSFDIKNAPEYLQYLFEQYQKNMDVLRKNPQLAPRTAPSFKMNPDGVYPMFLNEYGEGPHWDQFEPYNNYCPNTPSGRAYAGCAAVAFAHIMKGLQYPPQGHGEISYTYMLNDQPVTVTDEFYRHYYRYSNSYMPNAVSASSTKWRDIAQLIFDAGASFNTRYSASSSDASYKDIVKGMIAHFDYNPNIQFLLKQNFAEQTWREKMYTEIDSGRPIYYFGYRVISNSGADCHIGHAFVIDGYNSEGMVRIIWGFQQNEYNSYFSFDLLSPRIYGDTPYEHDEKKEGFNADQGAIIGIRPARADEPGGIVQKAVNLVADTMPATDVRATIDVAAYSGPWSGTLRCGIVSKTVNQSNNSVTYSTYYTFNREVTLDENGIASVDVSGSYPMLSNGQTYYFVIWSPYFPNNYDWNWFLADPVPFTVGDWETPPEPEWALGDVNHDNEVNVADVTDLIQYVLTSGELPEEFYVDQANVDGDEAGQINVADVTALIQLVLNN